MKIYAVEYNPEKNEGVYALSVVKNPAMQSQWITLSEQKAMKLATIDEERRILMGIALIPNKPIYRRDESGEYNIVFSSKTIAKAAHDFVRRGNTNNSTLEHEIDLGSDAVSVVESWIIEDDTHDKSRKFGFKEPVGSWAVMMKVHDDKTWELAKQGEITGFSIDGLFDMREINKSVNMSNSNESLNAVQKLGKLLMSFGESKPKEEAPAPAQQLGEVKTDKGVSIMYEGDVLESGAVVFIENEGERVPLPVGEYMLEDGKMLVVSEEGMAGEIKDAAMPEEQELTEEERANIEKMIDEIFGLSEMKSKIEEVTAKLSEVKKENESLKAELKEVGEQPAVKKVAPKKEVKNVELSEPRNNAHKLFNYLRSK